VCGLDDGGRVGDIGQHLFQRIRRARRQIASTALTVDYRPGEDAAQPGARSLLIAKLPAGAPCTFERILDSSFALLFVAGQPAGEPQQRRQFGGNTASEYVARRVCARYPVLPAHQS
jgi:hypothetical protein